MVRPHLFVLNKMDIADIGTNEAVKATLMQEHGINNVLFVSCKQTSSIKHKVNCIAFTGYSLYFYGVRDIETFV